MRYRLAPLFCRPWTLNGITPRLIESHYENNYGAALNRLNAITEELESLDPATTPAPVISRLKRDQSVVLNSTLLHELYFASLGGDGRKLTEVIAAAIERDFGSIDRWRSEFAAMASALAGGSGWVLLTYVPRHRLLINQSGSDHNQSVAGGIPILALDMYEHAYHLEFGANATAYVEAFMRLIAWPVVTARLMQATAQHQLCESQASDDALPSISVEELGALLEMDPRPQVVDVRPKNYVARSPDTMPNAVWRDPERVDDWGGQLSSGTPVFVYCAYGFEVGCNVATALRQRGFDARYVRGGLAAWCGAEGPRAGRAAG